MKRSYFFPLPLGPEYPWFAGEMIFELPLDPPFFIGMAFLLVGGQNKMGGLKRLKSS